MAWSNLITNSIRSALSVLGIVIGIAAVIVVLGLSAGTRMRIIEHMNAMGADVLSARGVYDEKSRRIGRFELEDLERLSRHSFVIRATPQINTMKDVRSRGASALTSINGVDEKYFNPGRMRLIDGRFFSPIEVRDRARLCVINEEAATNFFANMTAVGQMLYIEGEPWTVIGVFGPALGPGNRRTSRPSWAQETEILLPTPSLLRTLKDVAITGIRIQIRPEESGRAIPVLIADLERGDPNRVGLFAISDSREYAARRLQANRIFSLLGVIVAGVSLIVGGIGMMNVMLTSVAERTHEIGVRRAVGARKKDILTQFLVESCVLSGLAGLLGLLLGAALTRLFPMLTDGQIPAVIQANSLPIALAAGTLLGMVFGIYPAIKAASLSPAQALRSE